MRPHSLLSLLLEFKLRQLRTQLYPVKGWVAVKELSMDLLAVEVDSSVMPLDLEVIRAGILAPRSQLTLPLDFHGLLELLHLLLVDSQPLA
jgi:hypothetical protein